MNKRRLLLLGGLAILLVCACATVFMFMLPGGDDGQETTQRAADVVETNEELEGNSTPQQQEEIAPADDSAEIESTDESISVPTDKPEPTVEPTPTDEPTATPVPPQGMSRGNPFPIDTIVEAPNWNVQVIEVVRGDEAWSQIQAANQFNDPPLEGMEYVLIKVKAVSTHSDSESHFISGSDFGITGDKLIYYRPTSVVAPEPELSAELFSGGETEGWIPFSIGEGEESLILVVDEILNFDEDRRRFIAIEENTSIVADPSLFDIDPTSLGMSRSAPAPIGDTVVTDDWEITVTDMVRGEEAWAIVQTTNQFNEPPAEGMEYVAVELQVRYIGTDERTVNISGADFSLTGEFNILYNWPSIVDPEPALDVYLYPGGQYDGWTVMEAREDEGHLMVRFAPLFEFSDDQVRYLAIVDQASVSIPAELAEIEPNGLGEERSDPAPLGETVITDEWEFTILEVVRGNEALAMAQQANQFNDPPEPGTEYVAIKVRVRNIDTQDSPEDVSDSFFKTVDDTNVEYDLPSVVDPDPALDISLYPDGEYEGWVVLQASEGGNDLIAVVSPLFSFETYYMALEP